jgi:hypothetical protein
MLKVNENYAILKAFPHEQDEGDALSKPACYCKNVTVQVNIASSTKI